MLTPMEKRLSIHPSLDRNPTEEAVASSRKKADPLRRVAKKKRRLSVQPPYQVRLEPTPVELERLPSLEPCSAY